MLSQVSEPRTSSPNRVGYLFYIVLTAAQMVVGGVFLYLHADDHHGWGDLKLWLYLWTHLSYIAITATAVSICITEMGGSIVVLANDLRLWLERRRQQRDERIRQEGHEEGQIERDAEWTGWLERMRQAQAEDQEFNEPPPSKVKPD